MEDKTKDLIERYHRMERGEDREEHTADMMGMEISEEDYKNVGAMAVNSLLMLRDLVQRVKELISAKD